MSRAKHEPRRTWRAPAAIPLSRSSLGWLVAAASFCGCGPEKPPDPPPPTAAQFAGAPLLASEERRDTDLPTLAIDARGYPWIAAVEFAAGRTEIVLRRVTQAGRGARLTVSEPHEEDVTSPCVAICGDKLVLVWVAMKGAEPRLRWRCIDPHSGVALGGAQDLGGEAEILPDLSGDGAMAWLASVVKTGQRLVARVRRFDGAAFGPPIELSDPAGDAWDPAVLATGDGAVVAYDHTALPDGTADVYLRRVVGEQVAAPIAIASSPLFEAHPSLARDGQGRVWIAYDQGDPRWGRAGSHFTMASSLHLRRSIGIRVLDGDRLLQPERPLARSLPQENRAVHEYPRLAFDRDSRPYLLFRSIPTENPLPKNERSVWRGFLFGSGGLQRVRFSAGRNDVRPAFAMGADDRLWAAWTADLRGVDRSDDEPWFKPVVPDGAQSVFLADMRQMAGAGDGHPFEPLVPARSADPAAPLFDLAGLEAKAPWQPDDYVEVAGAAPTDVGTFTENRLTVDHGGRRLQSYFGDLHRHSDISRCWMNKDGSLEDAYRYALDAAHLDFLAVTNHPAHMTSWDRRRQELSVDLYHLPGRLATFFGYEHVEPHGHKNVIFPSRKGVLVSYARAARAGRDDALAADPGEFLAALAGTGGIAIPHTPAGQGKGDEYGTDWSYHNDPVQRLVEIYQGYRGSYEARNAPRAFPEPAQPGSFVNDALKLGHRLGFVASSDHHSTLGGYAGVFAEECSRTAIFAALRDRHTFAATTRMALFVASDQGMMGDEIAAEGALRLRIQAVGSGPIERVDIIRDGDVVLSRPGAGAAFDGTVDVPLTAASSYVYVRVIQADGEIAWASPLFLRR